MKQYHQMAAVDGGGTKTEFVLFRASGDVLRRVCLGSSNPFDIGFDRTAALLREGVERLLQDTDGIDSLFAGLSGGASGDSTEKLRAIVRGILPGIPCDAGSDMINAIASGSLSGDGCALIAGTGSSAFARVGGTLTRCGLVPLLSQSVTSRPPKVVLLLQIETFVPTPAFCLNL